MKNPELREPFRLLLLENPNYFGNLSKAGMKLEEFKPVVEIISDTYYEELTCISFAPDTNELTGVVQIKQTTGYSGGPCTDGSKEYIRFYVDYERDGTWVDEGVVNFDSHDLPFDENLCYTVTLKIDPKKKSCCDDAPVLPRVRGILSWNYEPPADQPDWLPVWGNHLEVNIQIASRSDLFCLLKAKLADLSIAIKPGELETLASVLKIEKEPTSLPPTFLALKEQYGEKVEDARFGYKFIDALTKEPNQLALLDKVATLKMYGLDIAKVSEFLQEAEFNTSYEEVKCVGIDRDWSILNASILVKHPSGYSGDLCHEGSLEYVAFYMDFGSGWEHMGTNSVGVHDIPQIPRDGLCYNVALPVSLSEHQKVWCETDKARVRAILSWNVLPTPNDPDYVAPWGDWEECAVEVKPLPQGVAPGEIVPVISSLGGMFVTKINASGYANGENAVGLKAEDSPFDGKIEILGEIIGAPDSSAPGVACIQYRIMVNQPSHSGGFQPYLREFEIDVFSTIGGVLTFVPDVPQVPAADGWMDYYPDFFLPDTVSVDRNLLGVFVPSEEGLHQVYIEMFDPNTGIYAHSNTVSFMVDKQAPVVDIEITSGAGNCGIFAVGHTISGTFSIQDAHCKEVELSVTPTDEAHGAKPTIDGSGGLSKLEYGTGLPGTGFSGTWELDTSSMDPCGYNIRIRGLERTIISSRTISRRRWDIEGFCLMV